MLEKLCPPPRLDNINSRVDLEHLLFHDKTTWTDLLDPEQSTIDATVTSLLMNDFTDYDEGSSERVSSSDIFSIVIPLLAGRRILDGGEFQQTLTVRGREWSFELGKSIGETMLFRGYRAFYKLIPQWVRLLEDFWKGEGQKALSLDHPQRADQIARLNKLWAHALGLATAEKEEGLDWAVHQLAQSQIIGFLPKWIRSSKKGDHQLPPSLRQLPGQPLPDSNYINLLVRRAAFKLMDWQPLASEEDTSV